MRFWFSLFLLSSSSCVADEMLEWSSLRGSWQVTNIRGGDRYPLFANGDFQLIVKEYGRGRLLVRQPGKPDIKLSGKLYAERTPKSFSSTFESGGRVWVLSAIYEHTDDDLKICFDLSLNSGQPPIEFDPESGILVTCKRTASLAGTSTLSPNYRVPKFINSLGQRMIHIEPTAFQMGSFTSGEQDELPHSVVITRPFHISESEVSVGQFNQVMEIAEPENRSSPVTDVSWYQAVEFCRRLSERSDELSDGRSYRIPYEAEWEHCCRAGTDMELGSKDSPEEELHAIKTTQPNELGIYYMFGNTSEWCSDWYGHYSGSKVVDPQGPVLGKAKVVRGGSFHLPQAARRPAFRRSLDPTASRDDVGFRVVCEFVPVKPDYEAIAKRASEAVYSGTWVYERESDVPEFPTRYAMIRFTGKDKDSLGVEVLMATSLPPELSDGEDVKIHWAIRGTCRVEVELFGKGATVHTHLRLNLKDNYVREVVNGEAGEWKKRDGFTNPMDVHLWGVNEPIELERELSLLCKSCVRSTPSLSSLFGLGTNKMKFGWWIYESGKVVFQKKPSDYAADWITDLPPLKGKGE